VWRRRCLRPISIGQGGEGRRILACRVAGILHRGRRGGGSRRSGGFGRNWLLRGQLWRDITEWRGGTYRRRGRRLVWRLDWVGRRTGGGNRMLGGGRAGSRRWAVCGMLLVS
jgi:hypothetical protein